MDFDPALISYQNLLDIFWEEHDATVPAYSRQYRSMILVHNASQEAIAQNWKAEQENLTGRKIATAIEPFSEFTLAENYHQKYYLRQRSSLMQDLLEAYPTEPAFIHATLSARLNALAGGYANRTLIQELQENPLLSERTKARLYQV